MTLYADSNSSYAAKHAIRIGRLMEEHGNGFVEEPCRFDHLEETKQVADALSIPVAGGDPFKDTSGPSLNILIKLISVVAMIIAPILYAIHFG